MFKQYKLKNYKFILIALVVILNTIGVALVGSASPGDQKKQIIGMVSGIIIMLLVSYIDYNFILRFLILRAFSDMLFPFLSQMVLLL